MPKHTQLTNEPGIVASFRRTQRVMYSNWRGWQSDLTVSPSVSLGNVRTDAGFGFRVRTGSDLLSNLGGVRGAAAVNRYGQVARAPNAAGHLYAGLSARAVARDIFLDGNTFEDSHRVTKEPLVTDFEFGAAGRIGNMRTAVSYTLRSKSYVGQSRPDGFLSISVTFSP